MSVLPLLHVPLGPQGFYRQDSIMLPHLPEKRDSFSQRQVTATDSVRKKSSSRSCPECGKIFHSFNGLKYHMSVHTGRFIFWCTLCQKGMNKKDEFNRHMSKHQLEAPVAVAEETSPRCEFARATLAVAPVQCEPEQAPDDNDT